MPPDFPLAWADKLRGAGIELRLDAEAFDLRRRQKTDAQLAGIRRAQVAADAAMGAAAALLRELPAGLTCEQVREACRRCAGSTTPSCPRPRSSPTARSRPPATRRATGRSTAAASC